MRFVWMQEVDANNLAEAMPKFNDAPVLITTVRQTLPSEPNTQRLGTQSAVHSVLRGKGREITAKGVAKTTGLTIKQVSNALTNLSNKNRARSNVKGWYKL